MDCVRRRLEEIRFREYFFGYLYLSVGRKKQQAS
jgi:hypothetical protein